MLSYSDYHERTNTQLIYFYEQQTIKNIISSVAVTDRMSNRDYMMTIIRWKSLKDTEEKMLHNRRK